MVGVGVGVRVGVGGYRGGGELVYILPQGQGGKGADMIYINVCGYESIENLPESPQGLRFDYAKD